MLALRFCTSRSGPYPTADVEDPYEDEHEDRQHHGKFDQRMAVFVIDATARSGRCPPAGHDPNIG